jgi:Acyl-ACP thioesterase
MTIIKEDKIAYSDYETLYADVDAWEEAKLGFYFSMIQEAGGEHSHLKGQDIQALSLTGQTWVVNRERIVINRYTKWLDNIHVRTWAQNTMGLICPRVVEGNDDEGNIVFHADTQWVIIDVKTGRPVRPGDTADRIYGIPEGDKADGPRLEKAKTFDNAVTETIAVYEPRILYLDTDSNHHVNNISYVNWITEGLENKFRDEYKIALIDCRWVRQTYRDDKVKVTIGSEDRDELSKDEPKLYFKVEKEGEAGPEIVFEAYTEWKRRSAF